MRYDRFAQKRISAYDAEILRQGAATLRRYKKTWAASHAGPFFEPHAVERLRQSGLVAGTEDRANPGLYTTRAGHAALMAYDAGVADLDGLTAGDAS